ncbi:MAG: hypothetical protein ACOVKJ_07535 [Flavobacterium sp.]
MKTNLDFLDTGSFLYIFIAVAIVALVLWSFMHEAIKPLIAYFKKPRTLKRRAPSTRPSANASPNWNPEQSPHFQMQDRQLKGG